VLCKCVRCRNGVCQSVEQATTNLNTLKDVRVKKASIDILTMAVILDAPANDAAGNPVRIESALPSAPGAEADHSSWAVYNKGMRGAAHELMQQIAYQNCQ
jgi:hypothetical protein